MTWQDAIHDNDFEDEIEKFEKLPILQYVGFLAKNDDEMVVLVSEIDPENNMGRYAMQIPTGMVQKIEILWEPNAE